MSWLSHLGSQVGIAIMGHKFHHHSATHSKTHNHRHCFGQEKLGILAFEAARTFCHLVSLYKSLSEDEILKLRKTVMRSQGVSYLNSTDEGFLLRLAYEERMEDLDRAAVVVSRLGKKCSDPELNHFENVYADMKLGFVDLGKVDFGSKEIEKVFNKIEKLISVTASLYGALEALSEMEESERKINRWNKSQQSLKHSIQSYRMINSDYAYQKLSWQRQQVQNLKHFSFWNQTFDKTVALMARTVCILYARICIVFEPYISLLPSISCRNVRCASLRVHDLCLASQCFCPVMTSKSAPLPKQDTKQDLVWFWGLDSKPKPLNSQIIGTKTKCNCFFDGMEKKMRLARQAPASTVGGSGLALRYANLIILAEKYLKSPSLISRYDRENMYQMLPECLKISMRSKLKNLRCLRKEDELGGWREDELLAEGWREGLKMINEWLAPMAHDTVRCLTERTFEKWSFETKPTVLLMQTLYFADKEKTEAAISEVLVGLSCICRYEIHHSFARN